ncbi:hypothetical protein KM043_010873 [Ampulex compressa]|nr:hypothetical protein KM043_010873 [Ampulex compressa]
MQFEAIMCCARFLIDVGDVELVHAWRQSLGRSAIFDHNDSLGDGRLLAPTRHLPRLRGQGEDGDDLGRPRLTGRVIPRQTIVVSRLKTRIVLLWGPAASVEPERRHAFTPGRSQRAPEEDNQNHSTVWPSGL